MIKNIEMALVGSLKQVIEILEDCPLATDIRGGNRKTWIAVDTLIDEAIHKLDEACIMMSVV